MGSVQGTLQIIGADQWPETEGVKDTCFISPSNILILIVTRDHDTSCVQRLLPANSLVSNIDLPHCSTLIFLEISNINFSPQIFPFCIVPLLPVPPPLHTYFPSFASKEQAARYVPTRQEIGGPKGKKGFRD